MAKREMKTWDVYWSPTGQKIATVTASTMKAAKRKAPKPYRKYLGEIYAKEVGAAASNPRSIPRGKWVKAQVMVTKSGKIKARIKR